MSKMNIGMIGAGKMGAAILSGIMGKHSIRVCEVDRGRKVFLKKAFRMNTTDLDTLVLSSDVILLAVKPQGFDPVLKELKDKLTRRHLVISIAAGITTRYLQQRLPKGTRVVRAMPNLPAQVGMGVTGLCRGTSATRRDLQKAKQIFDQTGLSVEVTERDMDALTAVSGSGPAYVFYFIESLLKAAEALKLNSKLSDALIRQTIKGSLSLYESGSLSAEILRANVTSKGGTTEAAFKVLTKAKVDRLFVTALKAAAKRSRELSK